MLYYFYPDSVTSAELPEYLTNDAAQLGESSFGKFWVGGGFYRFKQMIQSNVSLDSMIIMSQDGKQLTPDQFLNAIANLTLVE